MPPEATPEPERESILCCEVAGAISAPVSGRLDATAPVDDWFNMPDGSPVGNVFLVSSFAPRPRTEPRAKPRPSKHSRGESFPEHLHAYLTRHVPAFNDQAREVQHSLTYLAWIGGTGRRRHNTFAEHTTISYTELENWFGRGGYGHVTPAIANYLANKAAIRNGIAERVGINPDEVKSRLLAMMYGAPQSVWDGASIPKDIGIDKARLLYRDPDWASLARDIESGKRAILNGYPKKGGCLINAVGLSTAKSANAKERLAHLLQGVEVNALRSIQAEHPSDIVLLMHDGWVSRARLDTGRMEEIIRATTGYDLRISETRITSP